MTKILIYEEAKAIKKKREIKAKSTLWTEIRSKSPITNQKVIVLIFLLTLLDEEPTTIKKRVKLNPKKHKIDLSKTLSKILEDDFLLKFMVSGLNQSTLDQIPRLYNLTATLRLSFLGIILLCLQSSSFIQSLLFTLLELSYLFFTIYYQFKAKALSSKQIFSVRILEG